MTEYWNEFRLVASETGLDDSTAGEWLLSGMNSELQNVWGASSDKYTNITALANWAIEKQTKLAMVRHIQGYKIAPTTPRTNKVPRNPNGTYQLRTTTQEGDAMDLDATRRQPRLNISREEFQQRMLQQLCRRCGKPDHRIADCDKNNQQRQFNPQAKSWQPKKKPTPWQAKQKIREIDIESVPDQSGNEESPL